MGQTHGAVMVAYDYLGSMKMFPSPSCTMAYLQLASDA